MTKAFILKRAKAEALNLWMVVISYALKAHLQHKKSAHVILIMLYYSSAGSQPIIVKLFNKILYLLLG